MGKVFIEGGGFGIDTEDITARANDVVVGKTTINDDGDIVQGEVRLLTKQNIHGIDKAIRAVRRSDEWGAGKYHWSQENGDALIIPLKLNDNKRHVLEKDVEFLFVPTPGLSSSNMLEGTNVLGLQGRIPLRRVDTDMYNVMLPYDRGDFWGKGRCATHSKTLGPGVITSIKPPNGEKAALHEDVCFVFLPEANLTAENIKKDVWLFGLKGEMVDYSKGGMAFINATFDNRLLTGVAVSRSRIMKINDTYLHMDRFDYYRNQGTHVVAFNGIANGGLSVYLSNSSGTYSVNTIFGGAIFARSINLAPFRRIRIGIKSINLYGSCSSSGASVTKAAVFLISTTSFTKTDTRYSDGTVIPTMIGGRDSFLFTNLENGEFRIPGGSTGYQFNNVQKYVEIDISNINGHYFMGIGFNANGINRGDGMAGEVIIESIEFIN